MPKAIPGGLTRQHILAALADLDSGIEPPFGPSTGYNLIFNGKTYAPKAVIGLACKYMTGQMLGPEDFSGGEEIGQANHVLRALGFDVVAKVASAKESFITSRGYELPIDPRVMADNLWFNMWQRRLWPYKELNEGATLYWYDTKERAIVWRSRVIRVEQFEYATKEDVRKRFETAFGVTEFNEPYFDKAKDQEYCLAYKIDALEHVNIPKPAELKFPMEGWLRCSDEDAAEWLKSVPTPHLADGPDSEKLARTGNLLVESGYFSPASLQDERQRKLCEIVERRGQPAFRNKLIIAFAGMSS